MLILLNNTDIYFSSAQLPGVARVKKDTHSPVSHFPVSLPSPVDTTLDGF